MLASSEISFLNPQTGYAVMAEAPTPAFSVLACDDTYGCLKGNKCGKTSSAKPSCCPFPQVTHGLHIACFFI